MLEIIASVIGALGGFEAIRYLINRKSNQRAAVAEADLAQFHTLQETLQFLQSQLKEKEERFAEQTNIVRKLNLDIIDLIKEKGEMEVKMVTVRCDDADCPFRQPPNVNTPPKAGLTIEQYQERKESQAAKEE
jgi:DNA repair ATPase RecN